MMHWVWTVLIGFVIGALARVVVPGGMPERFWLTALIGVVGAVGATFAGQAVGWYPEGHSAGFVAAALGALVALVLVYVAKPKE